MHRFAVGLGLALGLLGSDPAMAQTTLVVLGPANSYFDEIEPGLALHRSLTGTGALVGEGLEFFCGSCDVATFDESPSVTLIGNRVPFCGQTDSIPQYIVENDVPLCMRSTITEKKFNLDLLTWSDSRGCIDADGGTSCASSGGYAAYIRSAVTQAATVEGLIEQVLALNLHSGIENSLLAKLEAALKKLSDSNSSNDVAAINELEAFVNHVEAQRGKKITEDDAYDLIATAEEIIATLQVP